MQSLDEKEWREFPLDDIFTVSAGKRLETRNKISGSRPFIGATDNGNGVTGFVGNENVSKDSNVLGVNYNGAPCVAFYHPYECIFTDDVKRLHLRKYKDSEDILLAFAPIIMQQRPKYSYGYKFKEQRMLRQKLMIPITDTGEFDYEYMTEYTRQKREAMLSKYRIYVGERIAELGEVADIPALDEKEWRKFKVFGDGGFLNIATTSSSIDGIRLIDGDDRTLPYVTRSDANNGISKFVSIKNLSYGCDDAGCIIVGLDTQTAFWQPHEFVTGQNIQVITGDILNENIASFLIPLLRNQMRAKFNWGGNGATLGRMKMLEMMLPVTDSGEPDYAYMEQYVKNMMVRKYKQYLSFLDRSHKGAQ